MSTNSSIAKLNKDGTVTSIYCHWDGYPEYNGALLLEYYNTEEKIDKLLALGDISSLGKYIEPYEGKKHSFDTPFKDVTLAYHRDRGEELSIDTYYSEDNWRESVIDAYAKYAYLWKDGKWYCTYWHDLQTDLIEAFIKDKIEK